MKDKIIAQVAQNLPSLITDIKTICNYDSRRDTATEDCPFGTRVVDCLNKALELISFFNSLVTSTFEGERRYTPFSICCNSPPNA